MKYLRLIFGTMASLALFCTIVSAQGPPPPPANPTPIPWGSPLYYLIAVFGYTFYRMKRNAKIKE